MFSVAFLNCLRREELALLADILPPGARILDLGAGTGEQARVLAERGYRVEATDIEGGTYTGKSVFPVQSYDGVSLPWDADEFDVIYTSNVLEHIAETDFGRFHAEIIRVVRPSGLIVHVMPSHTWRTWTTVTSIPDAIVQTLALILAHPRDWSAGIRGILGTALPRRHGERGTIVSEFWLFHPVAWRRSLEANQMRVTSVRPLRLFYTGNMLLGASLSLKKRALLSRFLGSSCYAYVCRPDDGVRHGRDQRAGPGTGRQHLAPAVQADAVPEDPVVRGERV